MGALKRLLQHNYKNRTFCYSFFIGLATETDDLPHFFPLVENKMTTVSRLELGKYIRPESPFSICNMNVPLLNCLVIL